MTPGGGPTPLRPRRGLVLGAGAAVGGAWTLGVLSALAVTEGFDASVSDVVVGTSAGSVLAALISSRVAPELMVATLTGGDSAGPGAVAAAAVDVPAQVQRSLGLLPRPAPVPGNLWLAARSVAQPAQRSVWTAAAALAPRGRGDLAPVGELVERFSGEGGWPDRPRTSRRRHVFRTAVRTTTSRLVRTGPAGSRPDAAVGIA